MGTPHGVKASAKAIAATERQRQALELRKAGATYQAIADQVGYKGPSGAAQAVKSALHAIIRDPATDVLALETERLDRLFLAQWPVALRGDVRATAICLKIMERRAKLLGLDAPEKRELTGKDGAPLAHHLTGDGPDFSKLSMEERFSLDQMFAKLADEA